MFDVLAATYRSGALDKALAIAVAVAVVALAAAPWHGAALASTQRKGSGVWERDWGTCASAVSSPANTWYLAEGCTASGFETWVLV